MVTIVQTQTVQLKHTEKFSEHLVKSFRFSWKMESEYFSAISTKLARSSETSIVHFWNHLSFNILHNPCDFCSGNVEMTQTHLQEECRGTGFERRGLDMADWRGVLGFWRRMTSRLSGGLPAAAAPAPAAGTSTGGSSTEDPRYINFAIAFSPLRIHDPHEKKHFNRWF